jgi:hypothetical protein
LNNQDRNAFINWFLRRKWKHRHSKG